jgi:hypothetical protein
MDARAMVRVVLNDGFVAFAVMAFTTFENQRCWASFRPIAPRVSRKSIATFTGHVAEREGQIANDPNWVRNVRLDTRRIMQRQRMRDSQHPGAKNDSDECTKA